ncbi:SAM-dependent methyltransferase [Streptomyces violascens]|uniref:SAM-dependent methyltransferase n=1 Tax=Streptomyces violascens TaxID=67381 RepID=UPI00365294AC
MSTEIRGGPGVPASIPEDWVRRPNPARIYNLLTHRRDVCRADRVLAQKLFDVNGLIVTAALINYAHTPLVVRALAERGITQFLDLGCGYPPSWSRPRGRHEPPLIKEALAQVSPDTTVLYVDADPCVIGQAHSFMAGAHGNPDALHADLLHMAEILAQPEVTRLFDPGRPIGVLLHDVLPWVSDDEALANALTVLRDWLAPGSALSLTHAATDLAPAAMAKLTALWAEEAAITFRPRTPETIEALLGGWPLLAPGITTTAQWHPEHPAAVQPPAASLAYAAVAIKPALYSPPRIPGGLHAQGDHPPALPQARGAAPAGPAKRPSRPAAAPGPGPLLPGRRAGAPRPCA